jgi:hypothetical protein
MLSTPGIPSHAAQAGDAGETFLETSLFLECSAPPEESNPCWEHPAYQVTLRRLVQQVRYPQVRYP